MTTEPQPGTEGHQQRSYGASGTRLLPWVAWGLIIIVLVLKGLLPAVVNTEASEGQEAQSAALVDVIMKLQGRMMLAMNQLSKMQNSPMPEEQIRQLEIGSVAQRQRVAVLTGVLLGKQNGLDSLDRLRGSAQRAGHPLTEVQLETSQAIADAFKEMDSPEDSGRQSDLTTSQRELLEKELGWFGKLLIARTQPGEEAAWKTFQANSLKLLFLLMAVISAICLFGLLGVVGLVLGLIWAIRGRLQVLGAGDSPGLFIETFAVWLVVFLLLSEFIGLLGLGISGAIVVFFLSLVALFWLPIRGMPLSQACSEIGLTRGRGWIREFGCGIAGFMMMIPILFIGVVGTLLLVKLSELLGTSKGDFQSDAGPAHPIFAVFAEASTLQLLAVFIAAAVAAPIVEEIAFRGLLYRHLRDGSRSWKTWLSILFAALFSGFIFAAIHPQGWMAIPALGSIGAALALAREWRQSLIAPMVMHGLQNGLVLTFVLQLID